MKIPSFLVYGRDRALVFCLLLIVAVAAVFWGVRTAGFVSWDDAMLIYANPFYVEPVAPSLLYFWQHSFLNLYMPLTYGLWGLIANLTHTTDAIGAIHLNPMVFHAVSLLLHTANCLLVFLLLRLILSTAFECGAEEVDDGKVTERITVDGAALAGTLLFALHPLQVEAVAWISETKGLLSSFFCFAALVLFCRFLNVSRLTLSRATGVKYWLASTVCFGAALLAKPNVVVTPVIALLLAVLIWRRSVAGALKSLWVWFAFALAMSVAMTFLQANGTPYGGVAPGIRVLVASDALVFYLGKLLVPVNLTINYGRNPVWLRAQSWVYFMAMVPPILGLLAWRLRRRPLFLLALVWPLIALLPNLGFIPFLFQQFSTVSDRYFYFAMIGPALALAGGLILVQRRWPRRLFPVAVAVLALLGALGCRARQQAGFWHSDDALYAHSLSVNPGDWASVTNMANADVREKKFDAAVDLYRRSLALEPRATPTHYSFARLWVLRNKPDLAIAEFKQALKCDPTSIESMTDLGKLYGSLGRIDESLAQFKNALALIPDDSTNNVFAGQLVLQQGNVSEADRYARTALNSNDQNPAGHLLMAVVRNQQGDKRAAVEEAGKALAIDPRMARARILIAQLLWEKNLRPQAISILQEGLQLVPDDKDLHAALAGYQAGK